MTLDTPRRRGLARWQRRATLALLALGGCVLSLGGQAGAAPARVGAEPGMMMIADQFNNRVIAVGPHHHILWHFGDGASVAGPHAVVAPNDAEYVGGGLTLIAGTGAPAGAEPSCATGCPDNRVMLVNRAGTIVWQYGQAGVTGAGTNQLNTPVCAVALPNGLMLITDQGNQRVIAVTRRHTIAWQYGTTGVAGQGPNQLNNPNSAEMLANGNVLIADENNNQVIEVAPTGSSGGTLVWQYPTVPATALLNGAAFASRLPNGNTLITDSLNNRAIEVTTAGTVVWQYITNTRPGSVAQPNPTRAVRLANGNTLISDQFNHQVIEVDHSGAIVFSEGQLAVAGTGFNQLNAPYDAKMIGDFTGLTPPPSMDD